MTRIDAWLVAAALAVSAPISTTAYAASTVDRSMIVQVAGGCGEGWHRGPNGGCRKNYREDQKAKHPCPRGYYLSPRTGAAGPTGPEGPGFGLQIASGLRDGSSGQARG